MPFYAQFCSGQTVLRALHLTPLPATPTCQNPNNASCKASGLVVLGHYSALNAIKMHYMPQMFYLQLTHPPPT